jgi:hypothetical protein
MDKCRRRGFPHNDDIRGGPLKPAFGLSGYFAVVGSTSGSKTLPCACFAPHPPVTTLTEIPTHFPAGVIPTGAAVQAEGGISRASELKGDPSLRLNRGTRRKESAEKPPQKGTTSTDLTEGSILSLARDYATPPHMSASKMPGGCRVALTFSTRLRPF